jgi:hypothetical protein
MTETETYPVCILKEIFDEYALSKSGEQFDGNYSKCRLVDDQFADIMNLEYKSDNVEILYYRHETKNNGYVKIERSVSVNGEEVFCDKESYNIQNLY